VLSRYQQLRHYLLIALMAFTLVGVQLMQASPVHDHVQHSVDCALCHLHFGDDTLVRHTLTVPFRAATAPVAIALSPFYASSSPSPYQGRAPPRLFS
jgi:hypothetical protein